jgi:ferrous iron transport protein A
MSATQNLALSNRVRLGDAKLGARGVIVEVDLPDEEAGSAIDADEHLRRLLEFGFVEGARIEVMQEGLIGHDPIAVRVDDIRIALRRAFAQAVVLQLDEPSA